MIHHCSTAVVHCIDFRLGPAIRDFLTEQKLYGDTDIISLAGACQNLNAQPGGFLESQIALSKKLHGIQRVILINHTDCGAYGGSQAFSDSDEEWQKHLDELERAQERLKIIHPDLHVNKAMAKINKDGSVSIILVNWIRVVEVQRPSNFDNHDAYGRQRKLA